MKLKQTIPVLFSALCISGVVNAQSSGKLVLSKGQKFQISNAVISEVGIEMLGQNFTINAELTHKLDVRDKKATGYVLGTTLSRVTTNGDVMGQSLNFDSDKPEDQQNQMGKALSGQINHTKEIEMNDKAEVTKAAPKDTSGDAGQFGNMLSNLTGGVDGDESNGASAAFAIIPAGKKAGDTWSDSSGTEDMKTYQTYTVKEVKGNDLVVSFTGKQVTSKKVQQQGMDMTVNMEGKISGEETVDGKTGILKQKTIVIDSTGTMDMMGQSIPMTNKTTTKTSVTPL